MDNEYKYDKYRRFVSAKLDIHQHTLLMNYCTNKGIDSTSAMRDLVLTGISAARTEGIFSDTPEVRLALRMTEQDKHQSIKAMLVRFAGHADEDKKGFFESCRENGFDPEEILEEAEKQQEMKEHLSGQKACEYFLKGLLSGKPFMYATVIQTFCLESGFSENQMHRALTKVAINSKDGKKSVWRLAP